MSPDTSKHILSSEMIKNSIMYSAHLFLSYQSAKFQGVHRQTRIHLQRHCYTAPTPEPCQAVLSFGFGGPSGP